MSLLDSNMVDKADAIVDDLTHIQLLAEKLTKNVLKGLSPRNQPKNYIRQGEMHCIDFTFLCSYNEPDDSTISYTFKYNFEAWDNKKKIFSILYNACMKCRMGMKNPIKYDIKLVEQKWLY